MLIFVIAQFITVIMRNFFGYCVRQGNFIFAVRIREIAAAFGTGPMLFLTFLGAGSFLQDLFLDIVVIVGGQDPGHKEVAASAADRILFPFFRAVGFFYV